jgi:thiamine-phosphate pyrophosphorylase
MADCRLYLISPPSIDLSLFIEQFKEAIKGGDIASFQLRLKDMDEESIIQASEALMPICHENDIAFILNDNPELAKSIGADGVHLGQNDMPLKEARSLLGDNMIIGVTCHSSKHNAMTAGEASADYVAFGAFFPTTTKEVGELADQSILKWWNELFEVPCVAIGGITVDNAPELITKGSDFIAVSSGIWNHPNGSRIAVQKFNDLLN